MSVAVPYLLALAALAVVALTVPFAYWLRWLTFTYGAGGLDPARRRRVAVECAGLVAAGIAFDGFVRWPALRFLDGALPSMREAVVVLLVTGACSLPIALATLAARPSSDSLGAGAAVLQETLMQGLCTLLLARSGSWAASGLLNGGCAALRLRLMSDVSGPWESLYFFASCTPRLKWLLLASPVAAGLLVLVLGHLAGMSPP